MATTTEQQPAATSDWRQKKAGGLHFILKGANSCVIIVVRKVGKILSKSGAQLFDRFLQTNKMLRKVCLNTSKLTFSKSSIRALATETYTEKQAKKGRPVSPHVTIYKFPPAALSSITNRVTGVVLTGGELLEHSLLYISHLSFRADWYWGFGIGRCRCTFFNDSRGRLFIVWGRREVRCNFPTNVPLHGRPSPFILGSYSRKFAE